MSISRPAGFPALRGVGRTRALGLVSLLVGVQLLIYAAGGLFILRPHRVDAGTVPTALTVLPQASSAGTPAPARPTASPPRRLSLSALHVDAGVVGVGVAADGELGVPADVHVLGWWSGSPTPGSAQGTTVIDGHVDSAAAGPGALFRLAEVPLGSRLTVTRADGRSVGYTVTARRSYAKTNLPAEVFATSGAPRLVVITCGGTFDRTTGHYRSNTVVYAVPD